MRVHVCGVKLTLRGPRLFIFLVGVVIGYVAVSCLVVSKNLLKVAPSQLSDHTKTLLIAVVTANQYIGNRTEVASKTWVRVAAEVGVDVLFYAGEAEAGEETSKSSVGDIPIIRLAGVDDTYPPQKKVFKMLEHVHVNYMNNYKWLLRADDDAYIRVKQLVDFLNTIDYQKLIYMGQPGLGKPEDLERLKLHPHEHFCMGGPGVVFSSSLLANLVDHLEHCLQHVVSNHEDVEVGKCISRQLGIQCTWAYDVRDSLKTIEWHGLHYKRVMRDVCFLGYLLFQVYCEP